MTSHEPTDGAARLREVLRALEPFGDKDPRYLLTLHNLVLFYFINGKYQDAESVAKAAVTIAEGYLGANEPDLAISLNNVGMTGRCLGEYAPAERYLTRVLAMCEVMTQPSTLMIVCLKNLGALRYAQLRYNEARELLQRALPISEQVYGADHPGTAEILNDLGVLAAVLGDLQQSEVCIKRSLAMWQSAFGPNHPMVGLSLSNLAGLLRMQGYFAEAEAALAQAHFLAQLADALGEPENVFLTAFQHVER